MESFVTAQCNSSPTQKQTIKAGGTPASSIKSQRVESFRTAKDEQQMFTVESFRSISPSKAVERLTKKSSKVWLNEKDRSDSYCRLNK